MITERIRIFEIPVWRDYRKQEQRTGTRREMRMDEHKRCQAGDSADNGIQHGTLYARARMSAHMTREEAAAALGVAPATLMAWETARSQAVNVLTAIDMCRIYGCTPDQLFGWKSK